jgi:hypothetical protein
MNAAAELATLFSILHDGTIASAKGTEERLTLRVECQYLAERFQADFYFFYIELAEISDFSFTSWEASGLVTTGVAAALTVILREDFEVVNAQVENGNAIISLLSPGTSGTSNGGDLLINCKQVALFTQEKRALALETLQQAAHSYWSQFRGI